MIFAPPLHRVVERIDRRVLGAFQFVDAVSGLPITIATKVEVRSAGLADDGDSLVAVPIHEGSVKLCQNRSGFQVILRAPFFDEYVSSFDNPQAPPETPEGTRLRLRLAVKDAGPHYLPREFEFDLPRPIERGAANNVFRPASVQLFRAPGAPVLGGWSVLRVRVTETGSSSKVRLPGVHVRVFRSPRSDSDPAIGQGMTEWRGAVRGEALVAVAGVVRFLAGGPGLNVFATTQAVDLEATRDKNFTGEDDQKFPDIPRVTPGTVSRRTDPPAGAPLILNRPAPLNLSAGQETTLEIEMP